MSSYRIPFNKPGFSGYELLYVADAIKLGHSAGYTHKCGAALEALHPGSSVLLMTSCTHALETSALLLDLQPGDEVITPRTKAIVPVHYALRALHQFDGWNAAGAARA